MFFKGKKIGITGGSGFIGYHLIESLINQDARVFVLDLKPPLTRSEKVDWKNGDVRKLNDVNWLAQCNIVFNLAAESNVMRAENDPEFALSTSTQGAKNILELINSGVFVVHASSREVYGQPLFSPVSEQHPIQPKNVYGRSKSIADQLLLGKTSVLRISNVIGTNDQNYSRIVPNWLIKAANGEKLPVFGGSQLIDFIPVRYVVDAMLNSAKEKNLSIINIGSGIATSLTELLSRIVAIQPNVEVDMQPARATEVSSYITNTSLMKKILGIIPPDDPLENFEEIAAYYFNATAHHVT